MSCNQAVRQSLRKPEVLLTVLDGAVAMRFHTWEAQRASAL